MNEAKKWFPNLVHTSSEKKKAMISIKEFQAHSVSLQRRLFRLTLDYLYVTIPEQITYKHEEAFLSLFSQSGYKRLDFPKQCTIEKSYDTISCHFEGTTSSEGFEQLITTVPASVQLPDGACLTVR